MVWQKLCNFLFIHIVSWPAKDIGEPVKMVQLHDIAGLKQRVKYSIVLSPFVIMAEEIVLLAHDRGPLSTFHIIVIQVIPSVKGIVGEGYLYGGKAKIIL